MGGFYVDRKPEKLAPHSRSQIFLCHLKKICLICLLSLDMIKAIDF